MLVTCFSTARSVTTSALGDRVVGAALGHQPEHLALARRQTLQRVLAAAAAEQPRDDLGVERAAALAHAPHGVDEALDVGDAVLEQVADALGVGARAAPARRPPRRTARARARRCRGARRGSRRAARSPSSVCVGGMRTSTIATSGLWAPTLRSRSSASPAWADDLEARVLEQAREALAQQHGVVGERLRARDPTALHESCPPRAASRPRGARRARRAGRRGRAGRCRGRDRRRRRRRRATSTTA